MNAKMERNGMQYREWNPKGNKYQNLLQSKFLFALHFYFSFSSQFLCFYFFFIFQFLETTNKTSTSYFHFVMMNVENVFFVFFFGFD